MKIEPNPPNTSHEGGNGDSPSPRDLDVERDWQPSRKDSITWPPKLGFLPVSLEDVRSQ